MNPPKFKMLYDGLCPFCLHEMRWLQKRDLKRKQMLDFEDISHPDFKPERYGLTREAVHHYLHGILPDGSVIKGFDVTRYTLRAVGFGWIARLSELPLLSYCCERGYDWFARYRVPLGRFFGRKCLPCEVRSLHLQKEMPLNHPLRPKVQKMLQQIEKEIKSTEENK